MWSEGRWGYHIKKLLVGKRMGKSDVDYTNFGEAIELEYVKTWVRMNAR